MAKTVRAPRKPRRLSWPRHLVILSHDYTVRYKPHILGNLSGICWGRLQRIDVLAGLPPTRKAEVLFHEVLHAVWFHFGLDNSESKGTAKHEEEVVSAMGEGILTVLRQNPPLAMAISAASHIRWCGTANIHSKEFPLDMRRYARKIEA